MDAYRRMRSRGYRVTPQRKAVLEAMAGSGNRPLNPSDIHQLALERLPDIGLATVYRTVELLCELGIVHPVHLHEDSQYYEFNTGDHHHHMVCVSCGGISPYQGCKPEVLEESVRDESDFLLVSHCLSLFGYCGGCRASGRD